MKPVTVLFAVVLLLSCKPREPHPMSPAEARAYIYAVSTLRIKPHNAMTTEVKESK